MQRQIVLDTETTGLSPEAGHRVIEIGCLELMNRNLTGEQFHIYLNPEREIDKAATKVHGIESEFLKDKPLFAEIMDDFLAFIKGAELIIHNAPFDTGFLNAELKRAAHSKPLEAYCSVFDTLEFAKKKHPGLRNNLDALCKRYHVVNSHRTLHGALLDSELLAFVYLAMTGGQGSLFGDEALSLEKSSKQKTKSESPLSSCSPVIRATQEELAAHDAFLKIINDMG